MNCFNYLTLLQYDSSSRLLRLKKTVLETFESLNNATLPSLSDNVSINPVVEANDKNDREKDNGQNAV